MSFLPITAAAVGTAGFSGLADAGATEGNSGLEGLGITGATLLGAGTLGLAGKAAHDSWVAPKAEKETGTPTYPTGAKNPPKDFKKGADEGELDSSNSSVYDSHGSETESLHNIHDTVAAQDLAPKAEHAEAAEATEKAAGTGGKDVAEHVVEEIAKLKI
jgi:hypothetical protein